MTLCAFLRLLFFCLFFNKGTNDWTGVQVENILGFCLGFCALVLLFFIFLNRSIMGQGIWPGMDGKFNISIVVGVDVLSLKNTWRG